MDKQEVIRFFDRLAPSWDADATHDEAKLRVILDRAGIQAGLSVLDVACGTGVLFPYYLERGVRHITGVDIAPGMIRQARVRHQDPRITLICADIETLALPEQFDCCMVYSAFPHFEDPARLITALAKTLVPKGRLTVAHSESLEQINRRHIHHAQKVSTLLLPAEGLAALFGLFFEVDSILSTEGLYMVSGIKKPGDPCMGHVVASSFAASL
ncbi:MAG: class I SAM-dependent methyltransferase [Treponema sp.]|jgi:demethylmenaquinone methyltransferase/2-methoxy-6-polyprenyl-1,4-benzoquinol methylase|nr:class I SAM-dependent methyltransferase [Treponema sp.]